MLISNQIHLKKKTHTHNWKCSDSHMSSCLSQFKWTNTNVIATRLYMFWYHAISSQTTTYEYICVRILFAYVPTLLPSHICFSYIRPQLHTIHSITWIYTIYYMYGIAHSIYIEYWTKIKINVDFMRWTHWYIPCYFKVLYTCYNTRIHLIYIYGIYHHHVDSIYVLPFAWF